MNRWISVLERTPGPLTGHVLVCAGGKIGIGGYAADYGWWFTGCDFGDDDEVTHWMALPTPPYNAKTPA